MANETDFLQEIIAERTAANPEYPALFEAALERRRLARTLAALRTELGLTQEQVAELMETSQPAVARLEKGISDVKLSSYERLAATLGRRLRITLEPLVGALAPAPAVALGGAGGRVTASRGRSATSRRSTAKKASAKRRTTARKSAASATKTGSRKTTAKSSSRASTGSKATGKKVAGGSAKASSGTRRSAGAKSVKASSGTRRSTGAKHSSARSSSKKR